VYCWTLSTAIGRLAEFDINIQRLVASTCLFIGMKVALISGSPPMSALYRCWPRIHVGLAVDLDHVVDVSLIIILATGHSWWAGRGGDGSFKGHPLAERIYLPQEHIPPDPVWIYPTSEQRDCSDAVYFSRCLQVWSKYSASGMDSNFLYAWPWSDWFCGSEQIHSSRSTRSSSGMQGLDQFDIRFDVWFHIPIGFDLRVSSLPFSWLVRTLMVLLVKLLVDRS